MFHKNPARNDALWRRLLAFGLSLGVLWWIPPVGLGQAAPAISGLSQTLAPWYGASFTLTINGQNFGSGARVQFGTTLLEATVVSSSELTAVVPASALTVAGPAVVKVLNSDGQTSNGVDFYVLERGDINHSRGVNIGDALVTALTVGRVVKPDLTSAVGDVNLSGSVNIGDALVIALFAGGITPNLPTPVVAAASPNPAMAGSDLTLTGTGFSPVAANHQVVFQIVNDGVVRVTPTAATATSLTVTVPSSAVSGLTQVIRLDAPIGSPEFALPVANTPSPLVLSSVTPYFNAAVGASLTLTGMGFDATPANNTVLFKSAAGTVPGAITAASATNLTVTAPADAVCGPVTVQAGGQTSNARIVKIAGTSCSLQLADLWGGGAPGDVVVLEGAGFDAITPANNVVTFASPTGTVAAPVLQAGRTQLHVQTPSTAVQGPVTVTVADTSGTPRTSNALIYRVNAGASVPVPTVSSVNPSSAEIGSTVSVTLAGSNFAPGATAVAAGGTGIVVSAVNVTSASSLTATFAVDPAAAPGNRGVSVSTSVGTSAAASFSLIYPAPAVGAVTPSAIGKGTTVVTISGSSFTGASTALLDGTPILSTFVSPTTLRATINSSNAGTHQISAYNPSPGGGASNAVSLQVRDTPTASRIRILDIASDIEVSELAVTAGRTAQLRVQIFDSAGALRGDIKPSFSSINPEIAVVDPNTGLIRGLRAGFSTLTVTAGDSVATATISVAEVTNGAVTATGVTQDAAGGLYLAVEQDHVILSASDLKQAPEVYAGVRQMPGWKDADRANSLFNGPTYLAFDNAERGSLYVSDTANHVIRRVRPGPNGMVETVAGQHSVAGHDNGSLLSATFKEPKGIALDGTGNLWVADSGNHTIRRIDFSKDIVETIAGMAGSPGLADQTGAQARFNAPSGIALETESVSLQLERFFSGGPPPAVRMLVADSGNGVIRRVRENGNVETLLAAGAAAAAIDGYAQSAPRLAVSFDFPTGIAVDAFGAIYFTEPGSGQVKAILKNGTVVAAVQANTFHGPKGLTITRNGAVVVADTRRPVGEIRYGQPEITRLDPSRISSGGGDTVTIRGENFAPDTIVIAGGILVPAPAVVNTQTITFRAPALPSGLTTVTVQNRGGIAQKPLLADAIPLREISPGQITTVAGGSTFAGDGTIAASALVNLPNAVAVDAGGNRFIAEAGSHRIRRVDALSGIITTVAGNGQAGFSGDNGPANAASLASPKGVAVDAAGNLWIADTDNNRVRKVDAATGIMTTAAGGGSPANGLGDNGPAVSAALNGPSGIAVDGAGNLFVADTSNGRIRKITNGVITTAADSLGAPVAVAIDAAGNLFIAESGSNRIRRAAAGTGVLSSVAGTGQAGFSGDNASATAATLSAPSGVAVDAAGNLFIADADNNRIRKVAAGSGIITTLAGTGQPGFSGDNGQAGGAALREPRGVAVDGGGNLLIADTENHRIRKVSPQGAITTLAGDDPTRLLGDNGFAHAATLNSPGGAAADPAGNLFIADANNNRVRRVDPATRIITTVAGAGVVGFSGDNGPATAAMLASPRGAAVDSAGNLFIADFANNRIRKVTAVSGNIIPTSIITTVAGNGQPGFSGDNGLATAATLGFPSGVAVDSGGNLFIADTYNHRIRKVAAGSGTITTVAGNGQQGFSGDNGAATAAALAFPSGVALDSIGNIFIADTYNHRIRKVAAGSGIIATVAGSGEQGFSGDHGPATAAVLAFPFGVAVDSAGNIFIGDRFNNRIRKVAAQTGIVTTLAGNGVHGLSGDGGNALLAALGFPAGVALDGEGNVFFADTTNGRIRAIRGSAPPPPAPACSPLAFGQNVTGSLSSTDGQSSNRTSRYADCYSFSAGAGDRISIALNSSLDTYLYLMTSGKQIVAFNDDAGADAKNSRIPESGSFALPSGGTYIIEVTSFSAGATGEYSLSLIRDTPQAATCSTISFGQTIGGDLKTADGQSRYRPGSYADCYTFSGNAGDRITIAMNSSAFDTYLYLADSSRAILVSDDDGGGGSNSRIPAGSVSALSSSFVLPNTDTFTIEAASFDAGETGSYTAALIRVSSLPPPACSPITFGQPVSGSLATTDGQSRNRTGAYADCFTFGGGAGDRITIAASSSAFDTYVYLTDAAGHLVAADDDGGGGGANSRIPDTGSLTLPATGTYTIEITSFLPGETGSYALTPAREDAPASPCSSLNYGQSVNGSLATTDLSSRNRSGRYADCHTFSGIGGDRLTIEMSSSAFDAYLYLMNSAGQLLASDDDGGGGSNSRIPASSGSFLLPVSGTYIIEATASTSGATGSYALTLTRTGTAETPACASAGFDQPISGSLATADSPSRNRPGRYADCYTFSANSGDRVIVAMSSSSFDTHLYLMNADGQALTFDDDGGGGSNSRIPTSSGSFALPTAGIYTIEATSFAAGETGSYTLTLTRDTASATPVCSSIAFGQTISGSLATADAPSPNRPGRYADCYTFSGNAGDRIIIKMSSSAVDSFLFLIDTAGQVVMTDDDGGGANNARIPAAGSFVVPAAGTYTIEATSYDLGETGNYSLTVTRESTTPGCTPISFGQTISGSLSTTDPLSRRGAGYADCYSFFGNANDELVILLSSTAFDAFLYLLDSAGQVVAINDDISLDDKNARIPPTSSYTLLASGTFLIEATSFDAGATGAYSLTLTRVAQ